MKPILDPNSGFKIGLFSANCSGGLAVTKIPERWSASYDTAIDVSAFDHQGSFTRTDASLTWTPPGGRISLRAFIRNIENKTQKLFTLAPPIPFAALEISDPQTYGVALSAKF